MKTIGVVCVDNINNCGDEILGAATDYIITHFTDADVCRIQFTPGKESVGRPYPLSFMLSALLFRVSASDPKSRLSFYVRDLGARIRTKNYYDHCFSRCDGIVTAVGMFKYSSQDFSYFFHSVTNRAARRHVPVYISAASIEKPSESDDERYLQLRSSLNNEVKMITTRDGREGVKVLESYLESDGVIYDYVGDPALWIPEVYGIRKCGDRDTIGVGLLRKNIFQQYKGSKTITESRMLQVYCEVIEELEKRGIKWQLFSNGMKEDYEVGIEVLNCLGVSSSCLAERPRNARELIETISGYSAVIGGRFHSCLIPYSIDIPVIGMNWDDKLLRFFSTTGREAFLIDEQNMNGRYIVDKICEARCCSYDISQREMLKEKTKDYLIRFVEEIAG